MLLPLGLRVLAHPRQRQHQRRRRVDLVRALALAQHDRDLVQVLLDLPARGSLPSKCAAALPIAHFRTGLPKWMTRRVFTRRISSFVGAARYRNDWLIGTTSNPSSIRSNRICDAPCGS
jgi:hypothetical protein